MNDYEPRGSYYAFKAFMRAVAKDIELGQGEIPPATVKWKTAHPKIHIGWFKRRLLRGEFRKRA